MHLDYNELACKYDIPPQEVQFYALTAMEATLSGVFGADIECRPDGKILVRGVDDDLFIEVNDLPSPARKNLADDIEQTLMFESKKRKFQAAVRLENTLVWGTCRYVSTGVYVDVEGPGGQMLFTGFAEYKSLPPAERPKWSLSGRRAWYVCRAAREEADKHRILTRSERQKAGRALLLLNRTSIRLSELLVRELAQAEGVDVRVQAVRRTPGDVSMLKLSHKVPPSVLYAAHKELGERIKVVPMTFVVD